MTTANGRENSTDDNTPDYMRTEKMKVRTTNHNHEVSRTDYLHFAPQMNKDFADIIDADEVQAKAHAIRPRPQQEVIVA